MPFIVKRKTDGNCYSLKTSLVYYLLIPFVLFSCQGEERPTTPLKLGGTYRIPIPSEITSLDPISGQYYSWSIGSQIYEGLLTYSKGESMIIPLLAESFEIKDLAYTFHLRRGVLFHDDPCFPGGKGRDFTAADVKYSFERSYKRRVKSGELKESHLEEAFLGYKEFVTGESPQIEGFKVLDRYTFEIRLARPDLNLLSRLTASQMFIVPREAVEYYGEDFKLHPVGTGPFRFSEYVPNEKLILVKNENYWGHDKNNVPLPYLDTVEYILYSPGESEKMLLDFQTGRIDECTEDVAKYLADLVALDDQGNLIFKGWLKGKGVQFVKDRVFRRLRYLEVIEANRKVRQAMGYAINRKRLIDNQKSLFQNYEIAKGPIPSSAVYFNKDIKGQYYDPVRARELLAQAGFPNGQGLPEYPLISLPSPEVHLIVEDLEAVGFKIKELDPFSGWRALLEKGEPLLVRMQNIITAPDVYTILNSVPKNECLTDPLFIGVFQEWQKNDENFRNKKWLNRLEKIIIDIAPVVFLYHTDGEFRFLQKNVRGRQLGTAWGHKLHYVWLDDDTR
ncbi:MAG: ABC transporter substrate-binding protein [bacterium]